MTAVSSSRWAGAITRVVEDQYQLGLRGLGAEVADLRAAVTVLEARCALRPGEVAASAQESSGGPRRRSRRPIRGYADAAQRFAKTRRLAILRQRLADAEAAQTAGRPSITVGGKRLWHTRANLVATELTEAQWRQRWDASRRFLTADGETGKAGGNETIRVDASGRLRVKVPAALSDRFGTHLTIAAPVSFNHRGDEWASRVAERRAVRYDINFAAPRALVFGRLLDHNPSSGRRARRTTVRPGARRGPQRRSPRLVCPGSFGQPDRRTDDYCRRNRRSAGKASRWAGSRSDHYTSRPAAHHRCTAIVVENLDFADARATGRETLGRGQRGKRIRRTVAGIPTAKFRTRLTTMAARRGLAVIGVDPAYTSMWGRQHWRKPLQQQTSDPATVTVHHGAAAAIGRRGLGTPIRRRPAGPRTQQRMRAGTPPARPDQPSSTTRRCESSGSPPRPPRRRGMPVHQKTPTVSGQHRSGRTPAELTSAH